MKLLAAILTIVYIPFGIIAELVKGVSGSSKGKRGRRR